MKRPFSSLENHWKSNEIASWESHLGKFKILVRAPIYEGQLLCCDLCDLRDA